MARRSSLARRPVGTYQRLITRAKRDCWGDGSHTIDCLSKRCCIATEQAFRGGTYPNDLEKSGWFTLASVDGQSAVCGNRCLSS